MKIPTWNDDCQQVLICSQLEQQHPVDNKPQMVRFAADIVTTHSVLSREEYTPAELNACFYTKTNFKKFKRSSLITLKLNREGDLPANHTLRGLECRTREGAALKKQIKQRTMEAAMGELERQRVEGSDDANALAQVLRKVTTSQQHLANVRGMCDELEAREYHHLAQAVRCSIPSVSPIKLHILDHPELAAVVAGPAA